MLHKNIDTISNNKEKTFDMKKILTSIILLSAAMAGNAQDTYQSATLTEKDLSGTARYVGMGGAMEALGADISTMSTNPAGTGLFRKTQATTTFSMQTVSGNDVNYLDPSKTKASFDQIGFIMAMPSGNGNYLNFGFNYHKSRNFNSLLSASNSLDNASQNKLSFIKSKNFDWDKNENNYSQVDYLYDYTLNSIVDKNGNIEEHFKYYYNSNRFNIQQIEEGYVADYDFNISANFNDRLYLGLTVGVQDIHYKNKSLYTESILAADDRTALGTVELEDVREITGTGMNIKLGLIGRPLEDSPFRIGAYVHTPTWYKLTSSNYTTLYNNLPKDHGNYDYTPSEEVFDFKLNTPWLFGLSLGHTVGQDFAFGVTYEYSDYKSLDNRVIDDRYYDDYYGTWEESSSSDKLMKYHTEKTLKGVHTVKVGTEVKVMPCLALRLGYNYVSPKYSADGYRDGSIYSQGTYYASRTDYVNWKATNRVTAGIGFSMKNFFADLAVKYSKTDGEYFPFMAFYADKGSEEMNNICDATKVSDKRAQLSLTLGYRF